MFGSDKYTKHYDMLLFGLIYVFIDTLGYMKNYEKPRQEQE